ncbi:MAG: hypothetical protein DHS20C01_18170 [marine bacterium B5-7]|nr:MAG: hypothetical protein DHS20C01_18170 [marine bacterium B5-7]
MLAFVHIQKTAGQTLRALLRRHFGTRHCDVYRSYDAIQMDEEVWRWIRRCYPKLESIGGHSVAPRDSFLDIDGIRFFTFLRDPKRRTLSHYQYLVSRGTVTEPFNQWAEANINRQTRALAGADHVEQAIEVLETRIGFTGLMESFDESLLLWKNWLQITDFDIRYQSVNVASSNDIREAVLENSRSVEILDEMNRNDQVLYEYVVENIYPRQIKAYDSDISDDLAAFRKSFASASNQSLKQLTGQLKRNLVFRPGFKKILRNQKKR